MAEKVRFFAEGKDADVYVVLRVQDVMALRADWDEIGAAQFLQVCSQHLATRMLEAGTLELARLLKIGEQLAEAEGECDA